MSTCDKLHKSKFTINLHISDSYKQRQKQSAGETNVGRLKLIHIQGATVSCFHLKDQPIDSVSINNDYVYCARCMKHVYCMWCGRHWDCADANMAVRARTSRCSLTCSTRTPCARMSERRLLWRPNHIVTAQITSRMSSASATWPRRVWAQTTVHKESAPRNVILYGYRITSQCLRGVTTCRIHHSIKLEQVSLFQDVWMQHMLITVPYYNDFNIMLI
jgi:hypothetical protein